VGIDRCPHCGAAVPPAAQWCTLCYANLRPGREERPDPLTAPLDTLLAPADAVPPSPPVCAAPVSAAPVSAAAAPAAAAPAAAVLDGVGATWPCPCGTAVPIADDRCPACFTPFLGGSSGVDLALPVVGDLTRLSRGARLALAGGAAAGVTTVLVVAFEVLGRVV
jgi:ribosomal protein L40E